MKWLGHFLNVKQKRYEMDLERVALEAVKIKIQEIFDKITVTTEMQGKDIVIRIKLPEEVMNTKPTIPYNLKFDDGSNKQLVGLDSYAQEAANELLGTQPFIAQE